MQSLPGETSGANMSATSVGIGVPVVVGLGNLELTWNMELDGKMLRDPSRFACKLAGNL